MILPSVLSLQGPCFIYLLWQGEMKGKTTAIYLQQGGMNDMEGVHALINKLLINNISIPESTNPLLPPISTKGKALPSQPTHTSPQPQPITNLLILICSISHDTLYPTKTYLLSFNGFTICLIFLCWPCLFNVFQLSVLRGDKASRREREQVEQWLLMQH